jgi:hypothetical protein
MVLYAGFFAVKMVVGVFGNGINGKLYKFIFLSSIRIKNKRMVPSQESYIKADDNRIINEKYIRWVKK